MKQVILIPQLGMLQGNKWCLAKDGNLIILCLLGKFFLDNYKDVEVTLVLPNKATVILDSFDQISDKRFSVVFNKENTVKDSAGAFRFSFSSNFYLQYKDKVDIIVTTIPEQIPGLRFIFGDKVKIASCLSYITYNNPAALADYFFEQYAGFRKSDICLSYSSEVGNFLKGIDDYSLLEVDIEQLNIAYSEEIVNKLVKQGHKRLLPMALLHLTRGGYTVWFIPTRLNDNNRTRYKEIVRSLKKLEDKEPGKHKFLFANPDNNVDVLSLGLESVVDFKVVNRVDYLLALKLSNRVVFFNRLNNNFTVSYAEALFLNGKIIFNEEGVESYNTTEDISTNFYSLENQTVNLKKIFDEVVV